MEIDHVVIKGEPPSFLKEVEFITKDITFLYGPEFYIEYNTKKDNMIYIRYSNINVTLGKHITVLPLNKTRSKLIKKHFKPKWDEIMWLTLKLPKSIIALLNLFDHTYDLRPSINWDVIKVVHPLYANIAHITGASGSGKTTLFNKLKDHQIKVFDTDDINTENNWDQKENFKLIQTFISSGEPVIFLGMTFYNAAKLEHIAGKRYLIDLDPQTNYKRVMLRILDDIIKNKESIKESIINDKTLDTLGVTVPFGLDFDNYKRFMLDPPNYIKATSDELFKIMTNWGITWLDTPQHLSDKKGDVIDTYTNVISKPFPNECIIKMMPLSYFDNMENHRMPKTTTLKKNLDEIFPKLKDRNSVMYQMSHTCYPVTVYKNKVIDGVHRLIACYLFGCDVKVCVIK